MPLRPLSDAELANCVRIMRETLATPQGVPSLGAMFDCVAAMAHERDAWLGNVVGTIAATVKAQALRLDDLEARLARFETAMLPEARHDA